MRIKMKSIHISRIHAEDVERYIKGFEDCGFPVKTILETFGIPKEEIDKVIDVAKAICFTMGVPKESKKL